MGGAEPKKKCNQIGGGGSQRVLKGRKDKIVLGNRAKNQYVTTLKIRRQNGDSRF